MKSKQKGAMESKLLLCCCLLCVTKGCHEFRAANSSATTYQLHTPGCNSGALMQIPGHPDFFVRRLPISTTGGKRDSPPGSFGCSMNGWQLGLLQMKDWSALTLPPGPACE